MQQQQLEFNLRHHLESTGEMDRIHHHLHADLIECGWRDAMKDRAKELIRRKGLEAVTMDELVSELIPMGRATVPPEVKANVVARVQGFTLESNSNGGAGGGSLR